jgi:hypothetical protein
MMRLNIRISLLKQKISKESLWNGIHLRKNEPLNAKNAVEISKDTFEMYWEDFQGLSGD